MSYSGEIFSCSVDFRDYAHQPGTIDDLTGRVKNSPALAREIARSISAGRAYLERRLLGNLLKTTKTASEIAANRSALPEYIREKISPFISYLVQYLRTCDEVWLFLYAGEKRRLVEDGSRPEDEREREIEDSLQRDHRLFIPFVSRRTHPAAVLLFEEVLATIDTLTRNRAGKELRLLLVGDCLFTDVVDFLRPRCAHDGLSLFPVRITSKNPSETREQIISHANEKFDAVFLSPFTYEYSREYATLLSWKGRKLKGRAFDELVNVIIRQTRDTVDLLAGYYDCPILVHNCGGFRRWEKNFFAAAVKSLGTLRTRRTAKEAINRWLTLYIEEKNAATFDHLFVVDEHGLVTAYGERALGRYIFDSGELHTAVFGKILADYYRDIAFTVAHLKTKKLIVCDLDDTLWRGTIGEGSVVPLTDRQACLQRLKKKGILLAICSKNNSEDVRWQENLLGPSDFVASRINWDPKPHNVESIERELKLKRKDFVFLDDSAIERDLISTKFPEISVLNPQGPRTWRLFKLWETLAGRGSTEDRTAHYQNEKARSKALEVSPGAKDDLLDALSNLQIRVAVREAARSDLPRAVELINRTNQFNLCGTRTTFRELQGWLTSPEHRILIAHAEDKFGSMGTVCVAVIHSRTDAFEIPVFVLSCRVIGYGIESAMLNYIRTVADANIQRARKPIIGRVVRTPHNEPCRLMYRNSGFQEENNGNWRSNSSNIMTPAWLKIEYMLPLRERKFATPA